MSRLNRMPSRLGGMPARLGTLEVVPGATKRLKGPKYQGKNGRNNMYLRLHPVCEKCLSDEKGDEARPARDVDHRVPLAEGGADSEENLQALCGECHDAKTAAENKIRNKIFTSLLP